MLRIDPAVLDDHARLAASLQRRRAAVEDALERGDYVRAAPARISLGIFTALFCEEVA